MDTRIVHRDRIIWGRLLLVALAALAALCSTAQIVNDNAVVRDSVNAQIQRELAEGLWKEEIANGTLKGSISLEITIDDKGRAETVFVPASTLPVAWKNHVKDQWYDHRFRLRLPKGHKEKVLVELSF